MKFRMGDSVIVTAGKDKGVSGKITKIFQKAGRVSVEGVNKKVRHVKGREGNPGERVEFFAPLDVSNVAIEDPKTKKPSRIGYKVEGGEKVRVSKASGSVLPSANSGKKVVKPAVTIKTVKKA